MRGLIVEFQQRELEMSEQHFVPVVRHFVVGHLPPDHLSDFKACRSAVRRPYPDVVPRVVASLPIALPLEQTAGQWG